VSDTTRVLVVSNMYPSPEHAAGGIFVHEQVKALRRIGLDARVVTGRPLWLPRFHPVRALRTSLRAAREAWPGWDEHDGVPVARFQYPSGAFARVWTYPWTYAAALERWLPALTEGFRYDVVHVHTAFVDGRAGVAAARHRRVPMVLTEHTGPLTVITDDWRRRLHTQAGMSGANRIVAVSRSLRDDILAQLSIPDPAKVMVLPNGVDTTFFDPARADDAPSPAREHRGTDVSRLPGRLANVAQVDRLVDLLLEELDEGEDEPLTRRSLARAIRSSLARIDTATGPADDERGAAASAWNAQGAVRALWVGHHVDVKRVDRLLDAFAIARRHRPELALTLLGSGPLEPALCQQAKRLGIDDAVRFLPATDREGVRSMMARSHFLVLPSQSETFGVVTIEALSMGLPVLATACGGPQDVLDDPALGMIVDNTMEDVALGLQRMVSALPGFDAGRIRRAAIERFDYGRLAERLAALYEELGARPARSAPEPSEAARDTHPDRPRQAVG
jgi:glycosyltransferase involved in cell wall biosynthesis